MVEAWDPASGQRLRPVFAPPEVPIRRVAVSPDGAWVVGQGKREELRVTRLAVEEPAAALPAKCSPEWGMAFSADGSTLATAHGRTVTLWRTGTWEGLGTLTGTQSLKAVAVSPDARLVATSGTADGIDIWDVVGGRRHVVPSEHVGPVNVLAFSPDGRTLATAGEDGTVRLWNVATRRELFVLNRNPPGSIHWVRFASPVRLVVAVRSSFTKGQCEVLTFPPTDDGAP